MEECCKDGKMEGGACSKDGMDQKDGGKCCGPGGHQKWCSWLKKLLVALGVAAIVLSWFKLGGDGTFLGLDSDHLLWNGMALLLLSRVCKGCWRKPC